MLGDVFKNALECLDCQADAICNSQSRYHPYLELCASCGGQLHDLGKDAILRKDKLGAKFAPLSGILKLSTFGELNLKSAFLHYL